jgi:hypothetical protein
LLRPDLALEPVRRVISTFTPNGMGRLVRAERLETSGNGLNYVRYYSDFPAFPLTNFWDDTQSGSGMDKIYVVQTMTKIVERCMLMTTDPGDPVVDPTCGSGRTAYVAEQWGRRWITIDTSRVAVAIARQRLLTSRYDFFKFKNADAGVAGGFRYKAIPHIKLGNIAQNTNLDPICAKHEPILDATLAAANASLGKVPERLRNDLRSKLALKQKQEGNKSLTDGDRRRWELPAKGKGWEHWEVPFDTDPDYPADLKKAVEEYRAASRAKMDEVNACIAANADSEELVDQPEVDRKITFVGPTIGYQEGSPAAHSSPFEFLEQDRQEYYQGTHLQTIEFKIAQLIADQLTVAGADPKDRRRRVLALQSRHQLFPQVFRYVDQYRRRKVNFQNCHPCELGLEKYVQRMVERLRDAIVPDDSEGEAPLMPITNRYKPIGTTAEVDFKTPRACHATMKSHIDQVVLDTMTWESSAGFRMESSDAVLFYARNDHMEFTIPYEYSGIDHAYEPDFLVRLRTGTTVVLEIKGFEDDQTKAKHTAANRWVEAVNNWGQLGRWAFHVCRNPQLLDKELEYLARGAVAV